MGCQLASGTLAIGSQYQPQDFVLKLVLVLYFLHVYILLLCKAIHLSSYLSFSFKISSKTALSDLLLCYQVIQELWWSLCVLLVIFITFCK